MRSGKTAMMAHAFAQAVKTGEGGETYLIVMSCGCRAKFVRSAAVHRTAAELVMDYMDLVQKHSCAPQKALSFSGKDG